MAHNLGFWIKWTLQLWPTRSRSQTVSDCLNSFNGLWGDNKTISVGGIVDGFLFAKYFLPPTLSPALPSSNHVSCVFLSVYIEMQSLVYIFSLYTVHLSALDIHNHLPTLNTSLYIQCGWVEFGSDQDKTMHTHVSNSSVLTICLYSKCKQNKQGQDFFFFQTQHQKLLSDRAVQ